MSLNPMSSGNYNWNYSNPNNDGYSETLIGTVVSLQEVQKRAYNPGSGQPGMPEFWPDGNPKMNIRMGLATPDGQFKCITFQPAGKAQREGTKPSLHMTLYDLVNRTDMYDLIGKTIQLTTWPCNPDTGQTWGVGNPRRFDAQLVDAGPYETNVPNEFKVPQLFANNAASGGQTVQPQPTQPANISVPQQPAQSVMPQQPWIQQPTQAQSIMQQAIQQHVDQVQAMQPAMPVGMDPQVAAQMQQMGVTNVQPYDDMETPF